MQNKPYIRLRESRPKTTPPFGHVDVYWEEGQLKAINADGVESVVPPDVIVRTAETSFTLGYADADTMIRCSNASGTTITVPTDANLPLPIGSIVYFRRTTSAGAITVANASGTVVNDDAAADILPGGTFALLKISSNTWDFI